MLDRQAVSGAIHRVSLTDNAGAFKVQFLVNGHEWEASKPRAGARFPSRSEARDRLEAVSPLGKRTHHYSAAYAAFSVCDYARAVECAELADLRGEKSERG